MRLREPGQRQLRAEDQPAEAAPAVAPDQPLTPTLVGQLQRTAGNAAVASLLQRQALAGPNDMRVAEIAER